MNWIFLVKQFDPTKPSSEHKIIDTYVSEEAAARHTMKEKGFCYVEPVITTPEKPKC